MKSINPLKETVFSAANSYYFVTIRQFHSETLGGLDLSTKRRKATRRLWNQHII